MSRVLHRSTRETFETALSGEGSWLTLRTGGRVLDAAGGAAVTCIGHGNQRVASVIAEQAARLTYIHTLFFTSEPSEQLAELLTDDGHFARAFFVSSGSEAMESALKMALQYHVERGAPERTRFIARRQSYHGNTFGALAVSGHPARRSIYEPVLWDTVSHVSPCFPFHAQGAQESDEAYVARLAQDLEDEIQRVGPDTVAAFVAETIVGATSGCVTATTGYFAAVREVCDRHGILIIGDEIMCGMGRSGKRHAWEYEGYRPDIQTVAKGLGGGYVPIGAMLINDRVFDALSAGSGAFVHGHTYQAHPLAARGALEVQRIIREEALVERVATNAEPLRARLGQALEGHVCVADIRGRGYFLGIEFLADPASRRPFPAAAQFSARLKQAALREGLALYPNGGTIDGKIGDHVIIAPPFNATEDELDFIAEKLALAVTLAEREARAA
ncbi:aspartate aminotransferase family protein [uncultured Maritimibacter sp.]|jgi:adenosylmethionine-8-amino-7-oxononanoate aminotransferase|uniref:aspartate aminotransferase family protein n=1 Tax=uncultured Maritimibacter sp. TaxID=991866 RepID=UPI000B2200E8|nr:aspartate aminotransferase family protein [uncultured Maritimibacter sp.]